MSPVGKIGKTGKNSRGEFEKLPTLEAKFELPSVNVSPRDETFTEVTVRQGSVADSCPRPELSDHCEAAPWPDEEAAPRPDDEADPRPTTSRLRDPTTSRLRGPTTRRLRGPTTRRLRSPTVPLPEARGLRSGSGFLGLNRALRSRDASARPSTCLRVHVATRTPAKSGLIRDSNWECRRVLIKLGILARARKNPGIPLIWARSGG